jgi:hypothetical protein
MILVIGLPALLILRISGAIPIVLLMGAMFAMFTRARQVLQPSAALAQRDDPRPPILFLRSFQDDRIKVKVRVSLAGIPSYQRLRFEEALGLRLNDFGPFLGIGEPGEGLPRLGAARAYLADDRWQAVVVNWIGEARLISMLCGPTHWIHWEMQNIIKNQRLNRVLLLMPPGRSSWMAQRRQQRWDNIVRSLEHTPYAAALQQLRIEDVLLVQFLADGRVRVFRSANDLVQDYELALTLAIYAALTAPNTREPKSADESAAPAWTPLEVTGTDVPGTQASYIAAKIGLFGLVGGVLAAALGMTAFRLNPIVLLSLRSLIFAAAVTTGAWLFYKKDGRFLGWLFGCVAAGYFIAGSAASLITPLIPRGSLRMGFVQIPFVVTWLLIPLGVLAALAVRFRNFRSVRMWLVMLAVGLVVGLAVSLGFDPREARLLAVVRFSVLPWTLLAACIGYGLSTREHPW